MAKITALFGGVGGGWVSREWIVCKVICNGNLSATWPEDKAGELSLRRRSRSSKKRKRRKRRRRFD